MIKISRFVFEESKIQSDSRKLGPFPGSATVAVTSKFLYQEKCKTTSYGNYRTIITIGFNVVSSFGFFIFTQVFKKCLQKKFQNERFQYKLMNTRTLVKPLIICLLFAEIFMVGVTILKMGFIIRIYLQDEQNPLSGFDRILFGPRSFKGCGSLIVDLKKLSTYKKMNVNFEQISSGQKWHF